MQIDHINIRASEPLLGRVKAFYRDVLGLEEGFRPAFASRGYWLYSADRPIVHLSEGGQDIPGRSPAHLDHVAFRSAGLSAFTARLRDAGIDYRSNYIPELGITQLFFSDPAGTALEVSFPGECAE